MSWTLNDYPASMKNLNHLTKMKAIDIANAMIEEGHEEKHVIPIAIEQAKKWRNNARQTELEQYEKSKSD